MGKLSEELKEEIRSLHDQGQSKEAIAEATGRTKFVVGGVIRAHRIRQGLEADPLEGHRGKRKVTEIRRTEHFEEPPKAETATTSPTRFDDPMFPKKPANEIVRKELRRMQARPRAAGIGIIGQFPPSLQESEIVGAFGGGWYEVKALNARGECIGVYTFRDDNPSLPLEDIDEIEDDRRGELAADHPLMRALDEQKKITEKLIDQNAKLVEKQLDRAEKDADARVSFIMKGTETQGKMMADHYQACLAMLESKRKEEKPRDAFDDFERFMKMRAMLKEDGGGDGDALTKFIDKAPDMLAEIGNLLHGPEDDDEEDGEETPEEERAPAQAKAQVQSKANGNGKAAATAHPQAGDEPASYNVLAQTMYARLIKDGVPKDKALQLVKLGFGYIATEVKKAQKGKKKKAAPTVTQPAAEQSKAPTSDGSDEQEEAPVQ